MTETTTDKPTDTPTPETPASGETTLWIKGGGILAMVLGVLVFLYFLAFHLGAAVLSFQKYGSFLWALLDFFFPYFYYPYYAFVAGKSESAPVESSPEMMGGRRKPHVRGRTHKALHKWRRI